MISKKIAQQAKDCSKVLSEAGAEQKNKALSAMSRKLGSNKSQIISVNKQDIAEARKSGVPEHLLGRLGFADSKIDSRIRCLNKIEGLSDPVGQPYKCERRPNGLEVQRVRVPLGVILMIYEARPHVTVNAGAFCLKSGNCAILRGGSEARRCNELLGKLWSEALSEADLPTDSVQVVSGSHEETGELLKLSEYIDLVIPRGGKGLIETVAKESKIPVIKHYSGVCNVYIDSPADIHKAIDVALDSKCLMPEVCNAMETLLVSEESSEHIPAIVKAFKNCGVEVRGCQKVQVAAEVKEATEEDWQREYLDNIVSIRVVSGVGEAIEHINTYGSHHTDSIVTDSVENAEKFKRGVDSGVVLINASTMFCDGESLGMGAEIGISTDKLHARGPMGLEELTSYKFVIRGEGTVMGEPGSFIQTNKN